ncbi:Positive regulator of purine utilization [Pleurostoma richardsiae]|uniref:Positive regulator of purine utilization n=1 Tax=Pleurostoma richardsiae TaxID=41990 RepID=A0AA38RTW8_9PEZI|nr:Positive regulator of purine utilization [Pleurostoma richardsiae]
MPAHSPPSPTLLPTKRMRPSSPDDRSPTSLVSGAGDPSPTSEHHDGLAAAGAGSQAGGAGGKVGQSSNFRNVSACNRCRLRKNRCDQKLPSCASCEKANVACVGYDPITKKEIPRSYVYYLETRVEQLEQLLRSHKISFPPSENLEYCSRVGNETSNIRSPTETTHSGAHPETLDSSLNARQQNNGDETSRLQKLVSKSGMSGVQGTSNPRYLGSTSGVSFARVVFAAVQSSVSDQRSLSDKGGVRPYKPIAGNSASATGTSMRDSFFGLHTKPTINPATFPDKELGRKLVNLYFEHANPQIPVLHRGDFMQMFEQAYAEEGRVRGPRELYMLNMVFAIGGGIIMGSDMGKTDTQQGSGNGENGGSKQCQPEEYHASAIVHLEACLSNSGGGLEELQAVLLLANFALLRPVPPGLWYIIGVAVRLAVDLGLHYEDGKDVDAGLPEVPSELKEMQRREIGRREFVRDLRRRLWWCTYSFDRLVSVCVGRPFGISDQVITTEFPSLLEDRYITPSGFLKPPPDVVEPTYKIVAHHYFRLRLLQSEILQVLQFQQAQIARATGQNRNNPYMHTHLPSPFLSKFDSFRSWRIDIDRRLYEWKSSAPTKQETGVAFSTEFLDLNYWQAIIMLYRQSLSVPAMFEGEYNTSKEVNSPAVLNPELREDEDRVYLKVAEAGQKILRLYRQLHLVGLVNYTYLATHHLFMAGISYLYAIWHSPIVRSRLTMDEVDFTILAATSVFSDLVEKCPPSEACRDAFDRTAKATIKMANSTGGFGQTLNNHKNRRSGSKGSMDNRLDWTTRSDSGLMSSKPHKHHHRPSTEHNSHRGSQYDVSSVSDAYSNSAASTTRLGGLQTPQFRINTLPSIKGEPDSFSLMRTVPAPPRSNASSDVVATPDGNVVDPNLMASPTIAQHSTPPTGTAAMASPLGQQLSSATSAPPGSTPNAALSNFLSQQQSFSPGGPGSMNFADLQGMDFLQGLGTGGTADGSGTNGDAQMDLGFGLGWEGMHHDFSDGQQLDLFDGFFFGGQQGGTGANGGM